jgi:uncharacterized protein (TIGR00369 family)
MPIRERVARLLPTLDGDRNLIRDGWDRLSALPGGARLFARLVGNAAPYAGTIGVEIDELADGRCVARMRDRRRLRNHIRCIHAIALANLAETSGNLALAYSLPDDARFIVKAMTIEYLRKARGTIRAVATSPVPTDATRRDYEIGVAMFDEAGVEVARATLATMVGPKPR